MCVCVCACVCGICVCIHQVCMYFRMRGCVSRMNTKNRATHVPISFLQPTVDRRDQTVFAGKKNQIFPKRSSLPIFITKLFANFWTRFYRHTLTHTNTLTPSRSLSHTHTYIHPHIFTSVHSVGGWHGFWGGYEWQFVYLFCKRALALLIRNRALFIQIRTLLYTQ